MKITNMAAAILLGAVMLRVPRRPVRKAPLHEGTPTINRWTGKPHEHKREIARRIRQQEVNDQRNFDRNYARI